MKCCYFGKEKKGLEKHIVLLTSFRTEVFRTLRIGPSLGCIVPLGVSSSLILTSAREEGWGPHCLTLPWSVPQVITYSSHHVYSNLTEEQKGRVAFASNFLAGDASLQIEPLKPSDEGRYTCKVKNSGRYVWSHVTLKVLGKTAPR